MPGSHGLYSLHREISLMQARIGAVLPSLECDEIERAFMVQVSPNPESYPNPNPTPTINPYSNPNPLPALAAVP